MKKLNILLFAGVIFACVLFFSFTAEYIWGAEKTKLEGEWVSTIPGQDMIAIFSGDKFSIKSPAVPNYWYKGTFKIDTAADPNKIDLEIKEGGIPQYVNLTSLGIYKIEEETLTLALNQPGAPNYPPSFAKPGNAVVLKLKKK